MVRSRRSSLLSALAVALLLAGCAGDWAPPNPPVPSSAGPVFVVHGVWPDTEDLWVDDIVQRLQACAIEALPVPYFCFVPGYLFGYGTDGPADRIADFERSLQEHHAATSCTVPLRAQGIGFSAGTAVLQKAAARGVEFGALVFGGSPLPAWSRSLARELREGRIEQLINYYSPIDPVVFWTCGSGSFGFHGGGVNQGQVENRLVLNLHWPAFWPDAELDRVVAELAANATGPPHTCFNDGTYTAWYLQARETLRDPDE